jgi:ABC-2 type transport system permease protein
MRHEIGSLLGLVLLPLIMVAFLNPVFQSMAGGQSGDGAAVALPGMAVLFSLFLIGHVGYLFFREHTFGTWERLRASPLSPIEVIAGKTAPVVALAVVQQLALFVLGMVLFGLRISGSVIALVAVAVALGVCLAAMGVAAAAYLRSAQRLNAISGVLAMVLGGLGGSLTPVASLPSWAQQAAPFSPGYWAVRGYRSVIVDGAGIADVGLPIAMLLVFAAVAAALAAVRFRFEETKVGFE